MNKDVIIGVVRLTPRLLWHMAGDYELVISVARLKMRMPRVVRAVAIWWMCRKQFPVRMVAVPMQTKTE